MSSNLKVTNIKHASSGSNNLVLASDGSASFPSTTIGGLKSMQVFTSTGTSTWTKPSGVRRVKVIVTGGGGGGGATNTDDMANGGGAGGTAIKVIDVTSVSSVSVTVGAGGAGGGNTNPTSGATGGTSSFGSYCSATGGDRTGGGWAMGGHGGSGSGGDINIVGSDGIGGLIDNTGSHQAAGTGGASYWGQGGKGSTRSTDGGRDGQAFGSGGGGRADSDGGRAGAPGIVVVEEYI